MTRDSSAAVRAHARLSPCLTEETDAINRPERRTPDKADAEDRTPTSDAEHEAIKDFGIAFRIPRAPDGNVAAAPW